MALDLDPHKDGEAEPDAVAPQHGAIGFDIAFVLQPLYAAQAGGGRQADALRELDIAQPAVRLERGDDSAVDRVEVAFGMLTQNSREMAGYCEIGIRSSAIRKDSPRSSAQ